MVRLLWVLAGLGLAVASQSGCAFCCTPDDYGSHYHGGVVGQHTGDGRVGSAYGGASSESGYADETGAVPVMHDLSDAGG